MGSDVTLFETKIPQCSGLNLSDVPIKTSLLAAILLLVITIAGPSVAAGIKMVHSDQNGVRLTLDEVSVQWREISLQDGSVVLFKPGAAGFALNGEPGDVGVPITGGWLIVPPGTQPAISSNQEIWESAGNRPLMVQPVPTMIEDEASDLVSMSQFLLLPGETPPVGARIPDFIRSELGRPGKAFTGSALELGEITWWRGHRIVAWRLNLVRHDGRVASEALTSGSWEITFEAGKQTNDPVPPGHTEKFSNHRDEQFAGNFLNGNLLADMPTEASFRGLSFPEVDKSTARGQKNGTLLGDVEGRLSVEHTNLFRVTYDRLRNSGYLPDQAIEERQIRLYQRRYLERLDDGSGEAPYVEIEVPIHMYGEGDDFDGDDFFIFYGLRLRDDTDFTADVGQGPESIYGSGDNHEMNNKGNLYWVAASEPEQGENWARMAVESLPSASSAPLESYRRTQHYEDRVAYRPNCEEITHDRIYSNSYRSEEVSVGFNPLWSPDPNGGQGTIDLQVALWDKTPTNPGQTLHFELVTDNTLITPFENYYLTSTDPTEKSFGFDASALDGETSKIVMTNVNGDRLNSYLNWAQLSFDALYRAVGNSLTFHGDSDSGARPMVVTGFTTNDLGMVEISDPRNPVYVALDSANIQADGDNWQVSIEPVQTDGQREFFVIRDMDGSGVPEYFYYSSSRAGEQVNPVELNDGPEPDLVVITHSDFKDAIEPWITHRKNRAGGNLNVHVVDVQDLYDWYSGGLKDPWALKRFTTHAINNWDSWALMLVGDANENVLSLGVSSEAKEWSTDYVPTHYHIQDTNQYKPEVLASDKWFATFDSGMNYPYEDFPGSVESPWQMYVGRFPCNSVDDLNIMIDKVKTVENVQAGQDWRKRAILFADDHWSEGFLAGGGGGGLTLKSYERAFADVERDVMMPFWNGGTPVTLESDTLFLDNYLKPYWLENGSEIPRNLGEYRGEIINGYAHNDLIQSLSQGGLMAHYQGHANSYILCSEVWMIDRPLGQERSDVSLLNNSASPWVFFGMGCHISDWAQDPVDKYSYSFEPSLGEKFLTRSGGGASATYASSGFEYITHNEVFGDHIIRRWIQSPPNLVRVPSEENPTAVRSRWMLGELMWYCEADILAAYTGPSWGSIYRQMVAQYTLLGDPLMMLDAGPPEVSAVLAGDSGGEISGEVDLVGSDATNLKVINIDARDEAGISHLRATDSTEADITESIIVSETRPDGETDDQQVMYQLDVPLRPFDHHIMVEVFDTASSLDSDLHYTLQLNIRQEAVFMSGGEEVDPEQFAFLLEEPADFQCEMTSASWLHDGMVFELLGENLELSNVTIGTGKSNNLGFSFTAVANEITEDDRSVVLVINGHETTYALESHGGGIPDASISQVLNYPNPMRDGTRFLFETSASSGEGTVRVFAVSGRVVANVPFTYLGGYEGVIEWNGRDDDGDGLANGTYLYRLEMKSPSGLLISPMQRLVVMN